ncbi:MAG: zinc metallopeptidase, partial [Gammaproteobacteria bacterium]|nr:zinc metallopeptidase [Gammaproteobacteria bacterium]
KQGDHYDPQARCVRLSPNHFHGHSLAAITVAAHEVGHAIQHGGDYSPMRLRGQLIELARPLEKIARVVLPLSPILLLITRSPALGAGLLFIGLGSLVIATLLHLVTLPVEFDASFRRALPLLAQARYLPPSDRPAARNILWACALTYLTQPAMSLLQLLRWLRPGPRF